MNQFSNKSFRGAIQWWPDNHLNYGSRLSSDLTIYPMFSDRYRLFNSNTLWSIFTNITAILNLKQTFHRSEMWINDVTRTDLFNTAASPVWSNEENVDFQVDSFHFIVSWCILLFTLRTVWIKPRMKCVPPFNKMISLKEIWTHHKIKMYVNHFCKTKI